MRLGGLILGGMLGLALGLLVMIYREALMIRYLLSGGCQ